MSNSEKTNILLIDTNTSFFNLAFPVYPLGMDYLQSSLLDKGFDVQILDLALATGFEIENQEEQRERKIQQVLAKTVGGKKWDIIGMGIRNVDSTYQWNSSHGGFNYYLPTIQRYLHWISSFNQDRSPIILGGSGFSIMPEEILDFFGDDYKGVVGPGERAFPEMVKGLLEGTVMKRLFSDPQPTEIGTLQNIDLLKAYSVYSPRASIGIRTKNGCGRQCHYCPYPQISGYNLTTKPLPDILKEIRFVQHLGEKDPSNGFQAFMFTDDIFNFPLEHAKHVLRAMIEEDEIPESWNAYISPKEIDEEFIELVIESRGWNNLSKNSSSMERTVIFPFDLDSGSDRMLKNMGKGFKLDDVYRSLQAFERVRQHLKSVRMEKSYHFLLGYLGEDEESIRETCEFIKDTNPDKISLQVGIRIYPYTPLAQETKGILWKETQDLLKPTFIPVDRNEIIHWLVYYLSSDYILLAESGDMITLERRN
jgi:radical SAM superfamily enzyme YgiQ (UPF0313 family)